MRIGKLYQLYAMALEQGNLQYCSTKNDLLIQRIIEYVSSKYTQDISLLSMAEELGYNYYYLSGVVNEVFGTNFTDIINSYRINHASVLLRTADINIAQISESCGFGTVRSFNRAFKKYKA